MSPTIYEASRQPTNTPIAKTMLVALENGHELREMAQ